MSWTRALFYLFLLGGSGWVSYAVFSRPAVTTSAAPEPQTPSRPSAPPRQANKNRALLLDPPPQELVDPTNHDVMVWDLALMERGQKIERDSLARLQELTNRYQLTANQRREGFPLLVRHHPDYLEGLIVNGVPTEAPEGRDFASEFAEILNLTQRELYQEDLVADRAWWNDVLGQIRDDLDGVRIPLDDREPDHDEPVRPAPRFGD